MELVAQYMLAVAAMAVLARLLRLPPLVGALGAGFVLHAFGVPHNNALEWLSSFGIAVLMFTIGLKIQLKTLIRKEIWLTSALGVGVCSGIGIALIWALSFTGMHAFIGISLAALGTIAFALSFSSTVFVVNLLETSGEIGSLYGRITVGILVVQDLFAVGYMSVINDHPPTLWALALIPLIFAVVLLRRVWNKFGHGEMQLIFGIFMAIVPGYIAFSLAGIEGEIGALLMGTLLSRTENANELSKRLMSIKDLLLLCFFLNIGFAPLSLSTVFISLLLLLIIPLKAIVYIVTLWFMRLRHRTNVLAALSLANFSEFSLIVANQAQHNRLLSGEWVTILSLSVAMSFVISSLGIGVRESIIRGITRILPAHEDSDLHPKERDIDVSHARIIVFGMGRIGRAAYLALSREHGYEVIGIDNNAELVNNLCERGFDVVEGDIHDEAFWHRITATGELDMALLALPNTYGNLYALEQMRSSQFSGTIACVAHYKDTVDELLAHGADEVVQVHAGAGLALADAALDRARASENIDKPGHATRTREIPIIRAEDLAALATAEQDVDD